MKTIILFVFFTLSFLVTLSPDNQLQAANSRNHCVFVVDNLNTAPSAVAQEDGGVPIAPEQTNIGQETTSNFFLDNWGALVLGLLGFVDLIARLTPSEKDNSIVNFLMSLFNTIIPNLKKGGGSFRLLSK